jgi:hypothetical protein
LAGLVGLKVAHRSPENQEGEFCPGVIKEQKVEDGAMEVAGGGPVCYR